MPVRAGMTPSKGAFQGIVDLLNRINKPDPGELYRIERAVRAGFNQNFGRQARGGGAAWAGLANRTQRERRQFGYFPNFPILIRSGQYMRSWTQVGGWREMEYIPGGWIMHVSSGDRRVYALELGRRARNLPARPVRFMDGGQIRTINNAVEGWFDFLVRTIF